MSMYYYDLCDDMHGEMLNEDMLHAMSNSHVSKHTLLFHSKDDLDTLLKYFMKYGYRTRFERERMHEPAWWHLHCIHIVERINEPFTDDKEEL